MTDTPGSTTIDTRTSYMGLQLAHPFMAGASPLSASVDGARALEDAGAAAIVLPSLFEEQITEQATGRIRGLDRLDDPELAARIAAFPQAVDYAFGPNEYVEHVRKVKAAVQVPVIASLNGDGGGSWLRTARVIEEAGADALEFNVSSWPTDLGLSASSVERDVATGVSDLGSLLNIPVAVKLSPFYTALGSFVSQLERAGANALVLFSRPYHPEIDIEHLRVTPHVGPSHRAELGLRLRWLAAFHGRLGLSLAASGGVETWEDGVRSLLAGAHAVQQVSALMVHGPKHLRTMISGLRNWMRRHEFAALDDFRGRVSLKAIPDPGAFERAGYIRTTMTAAGRTEGPQ